MSERTLWGKWRWLGIVGLMGSVSLAVFMLAWTLVSASGDSGVINACVSRFASYPLGNVRILRAAERCWGWEAPVSWSITGPAGPPGGGGTVFAAAHSVQNLGTGLPPAIYLSLTASHVYNVPSSSNPLPPVDIQVVMPVAGMLTNLTVVLDKPPGGLKQLTYTLQVNGHSSELFCTISGSATRCNSTASAAVPAGALVNYYLSTQADNGDARYDTASVRFLPVGP